jgi:hypothetical protein
MSICDGSTGSKLLVQYSTSASLDWNNVGHTWNDIRDVTGMLDVSGGDKTAEERKTFNGVKTGISQEGLINIILDVIFENDTSSFLEYLTDTWDGTSSECFWIRWAYNAGASGALRRTAKVALLTNPFTGGDPSSGAPLSKDGLTLVVDDGIYRDTV